LISLTNKHVFGNSRVSWGAVMVSFHGPYNKKNFFDALFKKADDVYNKFKMSYNWLL